MQFNSFEFILVFLPLTIAAYYLLNRIGYIYGKLLLILAGIVLYGYSNPAMCIILGVSILVNYTFVCLHKRLGERIPSRLLVSIPLVFNVLLLLFFKYTGFIIDNCNRLLSSELPTLDIILPLGISFFTFQQIAYVVSSSRDEFTDNGLVDYLCYILFFPKLLMGPLMEPSDFMAQINDSSRKSICSENIASGIKLFSYGLFKKMLIADLFSKAVSWGFSDIEALSSMEWVLVTLFYTIEIYFDFSGYCDMATGVSLMLNIALPINFDSPYKALSVRDFWKRWHISLTSFFTKYIYYPLGGNRKGRIRTYINVMIVFLISGIWHGANWTFILWGLLHGLFSVLDRIIDIYEKKKETELFRPFRWLCTFIVISLLWLLFRADSVGQWLDILQKILSWQSLNVSDSLIEVFFKKEYEIVFQLLHIGGTVGNIRGVYMLVSIAIALIICFVPANNYRSMRKLTFVNMILAPILFFWAFIYLGGDTTFVYFNF